MENFILKHKIAITVFVLIFVFGFGWWVWATTVGTDIDISGSLKMAATEVITSGRILQNVTTDAGIITSGNLDVGVMPTGGNWDTSSDLTIESTTFFVGRTGGTYAGRVGIGTATPAYTLDVAGNLRLTGNIIATGNTRDNCAWTSWTCDAAQSCASPKFVAGVERYTTGALCGSAPKQWYQMRLNCCDL